MHVCLVHRDLHQLTRGGICTVYKALAARLAERGHRVTLLTQTTPHEIHLPGVVVVSLPRTDDLAAHRQSVAEALAHLRPDIVDCSTWEAETLAYLEQPPSFRARVLVRGDLSAATMNLPALAANERELLRLADEVIAVSEFAACDLAAAYGIQRPQVVANGVDPHTFAPGAAMPPSSGFRVTLDAEGRVVRRRTLRNLITSGASVPPWCQGRPELAYLVWVGKITPMKGWDRLTRLIPRLREIAHLTILLGHAPAFCPVGQLDGVTVLQDLADADLPGFYRAADWLLSTSRWEGFGLAIAEAMACGTPSLLPAELGTAPELLSGGGGLAYRDDDHLIDLVSTHRPGPACLPEHLDWDANGAATTEIYRRLVHPATAV